MLTPHEKGGDITSIYLFIYKYIPYPMVVPEKKGSVTHLPRSPFNWAARPFESPQRAPGNFPAYGPIFRKMPQFDVRSMEINLEHTAFRDNDVDFILDTNIVMVWKTT